MKQSTLNEAAEKHSTHSKSPIGSILYIHKTDAFKAGAAWQKEQYKDLPKLLDDLYNCFGNDNHYERAILQKAIELLQDCGEQNK